MHEFKIVRTIGVEWHDRATDVAGPRSVTLYIDGRAEMVAQGTDDAMAVQNLTSRMRQRGFSDEDVQSALTGFWART